MSNISLLYFFDYLYNCNYIKFYYDLLNIINFIFMQFSKEQLEEFKEIYYNNFWEKLSDVKALEYWIKLVTYVKNWLDGNK